MAGLTPEQTAELDALKALSVKANAVPDEVDGLDMRQYKRQVDASVVNLTTHLTALFKLAA